MKNYFFLLFLMLLFKGFSQVCVPNPAYNFGGFYPQDSLPPICEGNDYETVITWIIPKDTIFNGLQSEIDSVQIWNVIGLPAGINYTPSQTTYLGGANGCINIAGVPADTGFFSLSAVCQWFYHQNGSFFAKIDTSPLPILPIFPALTTQLIGISDPHCGEHDGNAVLYGHGSHPPFTYSWNNGQVGTVATQLAGGIYTVLIENTIGCTIERSVTLETLGNVITANIQVQNIDCANGNNGEITATPFGLASPPFHYQWSNGDTTAHITNLSAGFYELAISDGDSCTAIFTATINAPAPVSVQATIFHDTMLQNIGAISVQASGGTTPYTFSWSNGNTSTSNTGLSAGLYTLWLTDANGCIFSENYQIFSYSILSNENGFNSQDFSLYPNPNTGTFFLAGNFSPTEKIEIYNLMGQKIAFEMSYDGVFEIKMAEIDGIYFLKIGEKWSKLFYVR